MLLKNDTADAVKEPYSLDLLWQESLSAIPEQQGELFSYRECTFFIGERKIWKINCDVSRIFLFLLKGRKCYVFMKYQLIRKAGQHIARFALLMKVVWCNLYKINSHLKMLGSCWVEVLGRWREMSSGGTCSAEPCQRGPSTGPQPCA